MMNARIFRSGGRVLEVSAAGLTSVVLLLLGMGEALAQRNPPTRLHVALSTRSAHVGDSIGVTVALRDAYDASTPAPKPYSIALEVLEKKTDPPLQRVELRIEKGDDSVESSVKLTRSGVLLVRASHPELREAAAFISVSGGENRHARATEQRERRASPLVLAARWRARSVARIPQPPPAAPPSRPILRIRYGHEGTKLTANGRDADTIDAFLSEPAAQPIRIHLWASSGWIRPNPIVIPAGEVVAAVSSELRTKQPGETTVRVETITPTEAVLLVEGREAVAHFGVPIKALRLWCSPSRVSLGSDTEVKVQFVGLDNQPISPDEDRNVEISVDKEGVLGPNPVTFRVGDLAATTRFLPRWTGPFLLTASTFGATTAVASRLDAVWPWPTTIMLVAGGLVGGTVRARKARKWGLRLAEVLTGPVVGVVAYLAVLYGLLPELGPFVQHPFFAVFVSVLAGYAGAVVLDRLAKAAFGSLDGAPPPADGGDQ